MPKLNDNNWDDKTDEIVAHCIDFPNKADRLWVEENRTVERFRVRYFKNGFQVGTDMYAFDMTGVYAIMRLLTDNRGVA